jgi:16S rRNA (cytidine1402-2'-O)-methyltransferase
MKGTLYLVATPIGNLQDFTFRAIETLKKVDLIACEDTRHTRKLLTHYDIKNKLVSYHEHNENERTEEFSKLLESGKSIAVVSDAGTPAICDPAYKIVQTAHEIDVKVIAIPGAVAFVNALIISGLPTDSVFFGGFLPSKKGDRLNRLKEAKEIPATLVFYETPHRIAKALEDCLQILGHRKAVIVRELTKLHEEVLRGDLSELVNRNLQLKGEIVLVIEQRAENSQSETTEKNKTLSERVSELEGDGIDRKNALKKVAKEFGVSRSEAYRLLINEKNTTD